MNDKESYKIQILIAVIGFVGVIGAAIISSWDKSELPSEEKNPVVENKKNDVTPSNADDSLVAEISFKKPSTFQSSISRKYKCNNDNTQFLETSFDSKKYYFTQSFKDEKYDVGVDSVTSEFIELKDWNLSKNPSASWMTKLENSNYIIPAGTRTLVAKTNFGYEIKELPHDFGPEKWGAHFAVIWKTKVFILKGPSDQEERNYTDCVFIRILPESGIFYRKINQLNGHPQNIKGTPSAPSEAGARSKSEILLHSKA